MGRGGGEDRSFDDYYESAAELGRKGRGGPLIASRNALLPTKKFEYSTTVGPYSRNENNIEYLFSCLKCSQADSLRALFRWNCVHLTLDWQLCKKAGDAIVLEEIVRGEK